VVFQNIWSILIFVTMSIHSWLLFILIACSLAISEQMPLKSTLPLSGIKFLEYPFLNSSHQICPKVHELEGHSNIKYSILWLYNPIWIMSISLLFLSGPQVFPKFILILIPVKTREPDCPILVTGYVWPVHRFPVRFSRLVQ
jgi:hypothetical protein